MALPLFMENMACITVSWCVLCIASHVLLVLTFQLSQLVTPGHNLVTFDLFHYQWRGHRKSVLWWRWSSRCGLVVCIDSCRFFAFIKMLCNLVSLGSNQSNVKTPTNQSSQVYCNLVVRRNTFHNWLISSCLHLVSRRLSPHYCSPSPPVSSSCFFKISYTLKHGNS